MLEVAEKLMKPCKQEMVIQISTIQYIEWHTGGKKCFGEGDIIYCSTEEVMHELKLKNKQQIITKTLNMEKSTL